MPHGWLTLLLVGASVKRQDGAGAPRVVDSAAGGRLGIRAHWSWELPVPHGWLTVLLVGASVNANSEPVPHGWLTVLLVGASVFKRIGLGRCRCPTGG